MHKRVRISWGLAALATLLLLGSNSRAAVNLLTNPSFESPNASGGDVPGSTGWGSFNFAFTTTSVTPHSGTQTMKTFGPFFQFGGSGVVQGGFAASPGQTWDANAFLRNDTSDPLQGANFATVQLQFLDAASNVLTTFESPHLTAASPTNTWINEDAQGIAPPNTVTAQIVLVHVQLNNPVTGGSAFFDDASLSVPEPASAAAVALIGFAGVGLRRRNRAAR